MRALVDTNVVLDVLLARPEHVHPAARLLALVDDGTVEGVLCATTLTTVHYLAARSVGRKRAGQLVQTLLVLFDVAPVDAAVLARAVDREGPDFEDAVITEAALAAGARAIVTRDAAGFRGAPLPCVMPEEFLATMAVLEDHVEVVTLPPSASEAVE
ncbi:MAG: PIN domain-containing protein [Coriobacteriia bacterium]|nr:PIN domain-containing protein [Coriobacteriia bacterium]